MLATVMSAALICAGALLVGQATLRVCGTRGWSWLAAPVGLSVLMLVATPALHLPGRATTTAAALGLLVVGALIAAVRDVAMRPPLAGLLAAAPVALLTLVPFAAAGHAGTLGVSFNNDMASHLAWAEAYRSEAIAQVIAIPPDYPLGAHALVAAQAQGLLLGVDEAFAGLTIAVPILLAWTALAALRRPGWLAQLVVATVVGMPFLVAGFYGQGSFKELIEAMIVLAVALELDRHARLGGQKGMLRWVPFALMLAGALCVYSVPGLVWPVVFLGVWVAGSLVDRFRRAPIREALGALRGELAAAAVALGVLVAVLVPQLPRLVEFVSNTAGTNGTGIEKTNLGNLAGRLPLHEAFGVWLSPDYRVSPDHYLRNWALVGLVLALVLLGSALLLRRGRWMLPAAAAAGLAVWAFSDRTQSPYVAAKALVMLTPLLLLIAALALVDRDAVSRERSQWWRIAAPVLAATLLAAVISSSWGALRQSKVGPRAHLEQLRELRPSLGGRRTLFLGNDDFIRWELAGVPVVAPVVGVQRRPMRREKAWEYGQPIDFDSFGPAMLNKFDWILTTRDAAGSRPPAGLRLVRRTRDFALWRRTRRISPRDVLREGSDATARLDCFTPEGRALLRRGGVAAVRRRSRTVAVAPIAPGDSQVVRLPLGAGTWELAAPYGSPLPITVSAPGLHATLPANLDRPGPRWPIGRLVLRRPATVRMRLRVEKRWLTPASAVAYPNAIVATPGRSERVVPLRAACGKQVDWYRARRS